MIINRLDTYKADKYLKKLMTQLMLATSLLVMSSAFSSVYAYDSGIPSGYVPPHYHDIKPYLMRDVFETETINISDIEVVPDEYEAAYTEGIRFRVFNSTTQNTEMIVKAEFDDRYKAFYLPDLELKKYHNYILFLEDRNYFRHTSLYAQALPEDSADAYDGCGLYEFKTLRDYEYNKIETINVFSRETADESTATDSRAELTEVNDEGDETIETPGLPVLFNGEAISDIKFRLVSSEETVEAVSDEKGRLHASLLEDIQYMVYADDDIYEIKPFPLSIKDKSEFGAGRYPYDHSTCLRVEALELIEKDSVDLYDNAHSITSLDKTVAVSGMSFGDMILISRRINDIAFPDKNNYTVELTAVNPHRWEISRLEGHKFNVLHSVDANKHATEVYVEDFDSNGESVLESIPFSRPSGNQIKFAVDNISQTRFVICYDEKKTEPQKVVTKPGTTHIRKITKKRRAVTLTWKKLRSGISGYQIQLSKRKSFNKGKKTITVNNVNNSKKTIRKLSRGKKYYVRIRTYLNTPSGRIYSAWSKKKSFKVK